jgi:TetR/AcrR family transcriptional repressor of nem operon
MDRNTTRDQILQVGTDLIARQGYTATGIDAVLKQAGVPKGSFYYYFASKEEFGLAVIDRFAARFEARLAEFLDDPAHSPLQRIRNYLDAALARLDRIQCTRGCLIGNLGQELADQNERFRARLDAVFAGWKGRFAACLHQARDAGELDADLDPEAAAEFLLSGLEGAILRVKVTRSTRPLRDFVAVLFSTVLRSPRTAA